MNINIIALGIGGVALLALASGGKKKASGNPLDTIQGLPTGGYDSVKTYYDKMRPQVGWGNSTHLLPTKNAEFTWNAQKAEFTKRNRTAATFALAHPELTGVGNDGVRGKFGASPDKFSKQSFLVYRPLNTMGRVVDGKIVYGVQFQNNVIPWGWALTDEYGRAYEGWGYGGDPFKTVLAIAQQVLPLIPGMGTAASASLAAAIALGQGKSLKDATLAAARASLPPGAQLAFDAGVGVASGQPIDQAAISALDKQYPGARAAYETGKALT